MLLNKNKNILIEIVIIIFIFLFALGSKGLLLEALPNYSLVGPDAYYFFYYFEYLIAHHTINNLTFHLYYPLYQPLDNKDMVSYLSYVSYILFSNPISSGIIGYLLNFLNIHPAANITIWLSADFTNAYVPAIAAIIFYFLSKSIFKDRYLALLSAIVFSINPFLTTRLVLYDTELGAIIFLVASFYLIIKYIKGKSGENIYKKIGLLSYSIVALIIFYYTSIMPNYDVLITIELFAFLAGLLLLYPLFKGTREYYLTLLIFTTALTRKGWGGWIIIPMTFGLYGILAYVLNKDTSDMYFFLPYMGFTGVLDSELNIHLFLADHNILFELGLILPYLYAILRKVDIFNRSIFNKLDKYSENLSRFSLILILFIIASPIIASKVIGEFLINPFTASRMGSTIAEFQSTPASYYFQLFSPVGVLFAYLGLGYLIFDKTKPAIYTYIEFIFLFLLVGLEIVLGSSVGILLFMLIIFIVSIFNINKNKKELRYKLQSIFEISTLSIAMYMIVFTDIVLNGQYISIFFSWMIFFVFIVPYILLYRKDMEDYELFILSLSFLTIIVGKYIYELVYYAGLAVPFLFIYGIKVIDIFKPYYEKLKTNVKEYLNLILLLIVAISGISISIFTKIPVIGILPAAFFILYLLYEFILDKKIEDINTLKYAIILLSFYGISIGLSNNIYGALGYIQNYFIPLSTQGTPGYEISAFTWIAQNTPIDSIINSWWDYGYYIFTVANRTAWIDGSNSYPYWNHLMGRYGLSSDNITKTLQLFYVHADYNYQTFKTLELFNENQVFYDDIYTNLGFTEQQVREIEQLKNMIGYKNWIKLLYEYNGTNESVLNFNLSTTDLYLLNKLYNMNYLRPAYLYIDPTDIGKSFAFQFLGSNETYDKESWISQFESGTNTNPGPQIPSIYYNGYYVFAQNNSLYFFGEMPLDQNLDINGTIIQSCIYEQNLGIVNQNSCGVVNAVQIVFNNSLVEQSGLYQSLNVSKITPNDIQSAYVYILDPINNQNYRLSLQYVDLDGQLLNFSNAQYGGMLYISPTLSLLEQNNQVGSFLYAYMISQKAFKYDWVQLYFLNNSYNGLFNLDFYSNQYLQLQNGITISLPPIVYSDVAPSKVWQINFPQNFTVPDSLYCIYLAQNLQQINECAQIYNLTPYTNYYNV
ncbi:oligosaccharyl transferase STT3 subunit [Nanobdella aerobiophila]|uniref:Oligosaccharyl transferase STT3 subunit n=1 Tax=Nanobdella aerobiophila TaxID=2586965 RepID=A0A915SFA8_9ARCH|nr:hypothetical protein [Nanobdella aerobiophila]BBL45600.1 oligosaccharyl transferase STT3 subunit [Nanobdella aerobiophila]